MFKKIFFLFFLLFTFSVSYSYTGYRLEFLSDETMSQEQKKVELLLIIEDLQGRINMLVEERKKEQNKKLLNKIERSLNLQAHAYGVYLFNPRDYYQSKTFDESVETLFLKNEEKSLPIASLTKVMTSIIAWENLDTDATIRITNNSLKQYGDNGLLYNEKFTLYDLMVFMLTVSSNDAAYAISNTYSRNSFLQKMNQKAQSLGMKKTFFSSESGLDHVGGKSSSNASVEDMAILVRYFYRNFPLLSDKTTNRQNSISSNIKYHQALNTNSLLRHYNNFKFSKTGYTQSAGGNLATVYEIDGENSIIIIVLGSTKEARFWDTETLIKASRKYVESKK